MAADLREYYRNRAPIYEAIYFRPDEQRLHQLEELARALRGWLKGRDVLEIAAGTGWWTVHAASVAKSVTATDLNEETLAIAKMKPLDKVKFCLADAYRLEEVPGEFDGFLACFWLSHVSRRDLPRFFEGVHRRLKPGSRVFLADNSFVPDFGGRFLEVEGDPDTYRMRTDEQGNEHQILKNYYSEEEFRAMLPGASNLDVHIGPCYWWVRYETA